MYLCITNTAPWLYLRENKYIKKLVNFHLYPMCGFPRIVVCIVLLVAVTFYDAPVGNTNE